MVQMPERQPPAYLGAPAPPPATPPGALLTLPNVITFGRLCAVPVAIYLTLLQEWHAAFGLFVAAGVSDAVDGWLARRWGGTALGAALDPLADKALMTGMYVTLAAIGQLPVWLSILVVFRDVMIIGGIVLLWLFHHPVRISPLRLSKVNTALQIALVALVLGLDAAGLAWPMLRLAAIWAVALSTAGSFAAYMRQTVHPA